MALLDLHRWPPMTVAFVARGLELLREMTTYRTVDQVGMRQSCERVGHQPGPEQYAALITEPGESREVRNRHRRQDHIMSAQLTKAFRRTVFGLFVAALDILTNYQRSPNQDRSIISGGIVILGSIIARGGIEGGVDTGRASRGDVIPSDGR